MLAFFFTFFIFLEVKTGSHTPQYKSLFLNILKTKFMLKTYKIRFESSRGIAMFVTLSATNLTELHKKIAEYQSTFVKETQYISSIDEV